MHDVPFDSALFKLPIQRLCVPHYRSADLAANLPKGGLVFHMRIIMRTDHELISFREIALVDISCNYSIESIEAGIIRERERSAISLGTGRSWIQFIDSTELNTGMANSGFGTTALISKQQSSRLSVFPHIGGEKV